MNSFTLDIPQSRSWTDEDLFLFCAANETLRIERDADGFITIMSPVETIVDFSQTLSGESVLEGFEFELAELRE